MFIPLDALILLHSEGPKLHSFGPSECNRVKVSRGIDTYCDFEVVVSLFKEGHTEGERVHFQGKQICNYHFDYLLSAP